jgi:hypothetical protein
LRADAGAAGRTKKWVDRTKQRLGVRAYDRVSDDDLLQLVWYALCEDASLSDVDGYRQARRRCGCCALVGVGGWPQVAAALRSRGVNVAAHRVRLALKLLAPELVEARHNWVKLRCVHTPLSQPSC